MALQPFPGFVGGYFARNNPYESSQTCINLYPESAAPGEAPKSTPVYKTTPGSQSKSYLALPNTELGPIMQMITTTPILSSGVAQQQQTFVIVRSSTGGSYNGTYSLYRFSNGGFAPFLCGLLPQTGVISHFRMAAGTNQILIVAQDSPSRYAAVWDFTANKLFWVGPEAYSQISLPQPANVGWKQALGWLPASDCEFMDGYFICVESSSQTFFISGYQDATAWDALDFAIENDLPDSVLSVRQKDRRLWIFGKSRITAWSDTGAAAFPFTRDMGITLDVGAVSSAAISDYGDSLYFLGRTPGGGISAYALSTALSNIAPPALSQTWQNYAVQDDCFSFCYEEEGHIFFVITFPTAQATWVYDAREKLWHRRALYQSGVFVQDPTSCHTYNLLLGGHIVGNNYFPACYVASRSLGTGDGNPITRQITAPHLNQGGSLTTYPRLFLDTNATPSAITLQWSSDNGATYNTARTPDRSNRAEWWRLGSSDLDRVYRVTITEPANPFTIAGAWIEAEGAVS